VAGIEVNPTWLAGYATTVEQAADDLAATLTTLTGSPLAATAFGTLGRQLGAPAAYQGAATTIQQQLGRAADALRSAAGNLRTVAGAHSSSDEDQAAALRRVHQS
jgi:uncharacterized protein YukE